MKETVINLLNFSGLAWWVKISTVHPRCIYYLGLFLTSEEAKADETGYIGDLEGEGAQGIQVSIQQCKPVELTIYDELESDGEHTIVNPTFSPQS